MESSALDPPDDEHDPEGATVGFERAMVIDLLRRAEADVDEVERSMQRLAAGDYGLCSACGTPIPDERLAARPSTRHCAGCAQESAGRRPLRREGPASSAEVSG